METRYLKTLVVAVETGSFSRTAETLHLTQSAVSQRIKFLEERYGHQLLDRSGHELRPTEAGRLVLEKARDLLKKEDEILEGLKRFGDEKRLAVCCTPTFGMAWLPGILNDFMLRHTDVRDIKFIFHQPRAAMEALAAGEFDLAIVEHCDETSLDDFASYSLPEDDLVFISAPGLGLEERCVVDALLGFRLYARRDGCSSKELLKQNLAQSGRGLDDFTTVVVSDDLRWSIDNVCAGNGIAFMSLSLVSRELESGQLRATRVEGFSHRRRRSVLFMPGRGSDLAIRSFLDCLFDAFHVTPQSPDAVQG
ncbi:MAG: LysR family transcriptional regulator [Deltaproteobacteria bacterium]|nr:MAG: LysR family transcriptional regulator [Deltaproteobacteria bacterium]